MDTSTRRPLARHETARPLDDHCWPGGQPAGFQMRVGVSRRSDCGSRRSLLGADRDKALPGGSTRSISNVAPRSSDRHASPPTFLPCCRCGRARAKPMCLMEMLDGRQAG